MKKGIVIANFGGPRSLEEVKSFLQELLCDRDVVRSYLPNWLHRWLFKAIALLRTKKIIREYKHIGSKSPIWEDTEWLAAQVKGSMPGPVLTFHRYLTATHGQFLHDIEQMKDCDEILFFPLFAQFSYATTGSIARWMQTHLSFETAQKIRWVRSYCNHPAFIKAYAQRVKECMQKEGLSESELAAIVSFHGLPQSFIDKGDSYLNECKSSLQALKKEFPDMEFIMSFQSKFGPGQWLQPSTEEVSTNHASWTKRSNLIVIPLAFTSDHLETLAEIENQYLPLLRLSGARAWRVEALNRSEDWLAGVKTILQEGLEQPWTLTPNPLLIASYCPLPALCPRFGLCSCIKSQASKSA